MKPTSIMLTAVVVALLAACGDKTPATPPDAPALAPSSPPQAAAATPAAGGRACMISGSFRIAGQTIRSRDCIAAKAGSDKAALDNTCTQLAQVSAQFGGEAGRVEYMDSCPAPAQGTCHNFMRSSYDAHYYERAPDDLADLPDSCRRSGGEWRQ